uniref:Uncharacterized protein n=1 Tax=Timema cristinae TaxID=61476 RepID=A0A7R9GZG6_TIMCR|nr:unnamed protein product [Timema cristinae]
MPILKTQSLYQICLENIVHNANFWLELKLAQEKNKTATNPFDSLPASLQQDILCTYERIHGLPGGNNFWLELQEKWRLFVTRQISKLTITEYTGKTSLVHIASTCRNLKHLELKNVQEALPYLKAVAPCLNTVLSLDFETMAHVNSASLKYIRSHCPNLKSLTKSQFKFASLLPTIAVAQGAIVKFIGDRAIKKGEERGWKRINSGLVPVTALKDPAPKKVLGLKSCFLNDKAVNQLKHISSLMELDLRDTEVTAIGICQVLKCNPQLRSLQHPEVGRALYKMHSAKTWLVRVEASLLSASAASYRLREIELELSTKDHCNMLSVVTSVCPRIERVRVEVDMRVSPYALMPLSKLEWLCELDIQCVAGSNRKPWDDQPSTGTVLETITLFEGSIVPILESRGKHIQIVLLEGVAAVSMKIIQEHCPHLISLGLYYNSYAQNSFSIPDNVTSSKPFPSLRRLLFGSNSGHDDFPAPYLEWLLSNSNLVELSLSASPLFTNELFTRVFANSSAFPQLRRLELDYCNVTAEVITEFLNSCGRKSLKELSICGPFVREQASPALCFIICEKLDVQVEAYFYSFVKMKKRMVRYKQDLNFISSKPDVGSPRHTLESRNRANRLPSYLDVKKQWGGECKC